MAEAPDNPTRLVLMQSSLELDKQQSTNTLLLSKIKLNERERKRKRNTVVEKKRTKKRRCIWVRLWLQRRSQFGQYQRLMRELKKEDAKGFKNFMRMDYKLFLVILRRVEPRIKPKACNWRKSLSAGCKLAITLRYLASGDSYHSLMYGFRVAHNTVSKVIKQVCHALVAEFSEELIHTPSTPEEWKAIADHFTNRWQLNHCVGAIDGKHVAIQCPKGAGSLYYNYKGYHSLILMALVDGDYKFTWAEVRSQGSAGDAQVFNTSVLKEAIDKKVLGLPEPEPLPHDDRPMPYFIAGDDAFALKTWLMKPYSKRNLTDAERIYNYRLSRGRRIVENAFGILAHRFRCLLTTLLQEPNTSIDIVLSCICLHNFMRLHRWKEHLSCRDGEDKNHKIIRGEWRKDNELLDGISEHPPNSTTFGAKDQRQYLTAYFNSDVGSVPWQKDML